jgi:hypothetical protein
MGDELLQQTLQLFHDLHETSRARDSRADTADHVSRGRATAGVKTNGTRVASTVAVFFARRSFKECTLKIATWAVVGLLTLLAGAARLEAEPVKVRLPEGTTRGFLVLRALGGEAIAHGELMQRTNGTLIESRLTLNFGDGSLWDEQVAYSQKDVLRIESYRHVQKGPSYPSSEVSFDRRSGRYQARTQESKDAEIKEASGEMEMPADLYNGMALVLLKNLAPGATVSARIAAFTPKPRLITMDLSHEGNDAVRIGPATKTARRHLVKLEVGGLTGIVATLIGKDPPDLRYWLVAGDVPAFVRFQGAMYLNGPVWRLEMAPVEWP